MSPSETSETVTNKKKPTNLYLSSLNVERWKDHPEFGSMSQTIDRFMTHMLENNGHDTSVTMQRYLQESQEIENGMREFQERRFELDEQMRISLHASKEVAQKELENILRESALEDTLNTWGATYQKKKEVLSKQGRPSEDIKRILENWTKRIVYTEIRKIGIQMTLDELIEKLEGAGIHHKS